MRTKPRKYPKTVVKAVWRSAGGEKVVVFEGPVNVYQVIAAVQG